MQEYDIALGRGALACLLGMRRKLLQIFVLGVSEVVTKRLVTPGRTSAAAGRRAKLRFECLPIHLMNPLVRPFIHVSPSSQAWRGSRCL
jgi:hypothetical protein